MLQKEQTSFEIEREVELKADADSAGFLGVRIKPKPIVAQEADDLQIPNPTKKLK